MDQGSEIVLPTLRDFFNAEKTMHPGTNCRDDVLVENKGFTRIPLCRVLNSSCKNVCPRPTELANSGKHKRGFLYQSTKEGGRTDIQESTEKFYGLQYSFGGSVEVCLKSNGKQKQSAKPLGLERNMEPRLQKSHSARVGMPILPSSVGSNQSSTNASSTSWFSRIRKMSNPFANLHPRRSRLVPPSGNIKLNVGETLSRNTAFQRTSPIHLHAHLNLENQPGMPIFKFSLDHPDDVYVANTWTGNTSFPFVYTFHHVHGRRNRYVCEEGSKDLGADSSVVGQMQVSTQICSDPNLDQDPVKSAATEFVLCDIAHARRSGSKQEKLTGSNSFKRGSAIYQSKYSENNETDCSNDSKPWPASDLHPGLEIAAIVIQQPLTSKQSSGYAENYKIPRQEVKAIIPTGNHGLPDAENSCPLPILQRWRSGGGCDCSGWDMGCHLFVLESLGIHQVTDNHHFLELFSEGGKEKTPAMTVAFVKDGQYEVDFHAKLSALQAFSICIAVLHCTQVSTQERRISVPFSRCSSLKELIDLEQHENADSVPEREVPLSFLPNVTFSPIARV